MVFSSYAFLFAFLPIVLLGYHAMPGSPAVRNRLQIWWLTAASYFFYGWSGPWLCGWILVSTAIDLFAGWGIAGARRPAARRAWLAFALTGNLGLLAAFKYADFAVQLAAPLLRLLGLPDGALRGPGWVMPIGISFYTFQSMSYSIDVYRGDVPAVPRRRAIDFVCFVALFPQLVAGPIVRFSELARQFEVRRHDLERFARGCFLFALGLGKKVLLADPLATFGLGAFAAPAPGLLDSWCAAGATTLHIYFDFAGYTDMAIGLGLLFGFEFPRNFAAPFQATSLREFWRRWHMTLTRWLRDYLYVPLGGSRTP